MQSAYTLLAGHIRPAANVLKTPALHLTNEMAFVLSSRDIGLGPLTI